MSTTDNDRTATAASAIKHSAERAARELLDRMGVPNAQNYSAGELVELANLIAATAPNATGETDREIALRFKREADALWHRVHTAEQNAARYTAWRDAMVAQDQEFIDAMALALPPAVGHSRTPTADEWDAAVDKAAGIPVIPPCVKSDIDDCATRPTCPTCHTHEVELSRTCHNSACASYATPKTTYEGWKANGSAA